MHSDHRIPSLSHAFRGPRPSGGQGCRLAILVRRPSLFRRTQHLASDSLNVAYDGSTWTARLLAAQPDERFDSLYAGRPAVQYSVRNAGSSDDDSILFTRSVPRCWTPRSAGNFVPSAASALDFPMTDRGYLGRWAVKELTSTREPANAKSRAYSVQWYGPSKIELL